MKASEFIQRLREMIDENGDLEVVDVGNNTIDVSFNEGEEGEYDAAFVVE